MKRQPKPPMWLSRDAKAHWTKLAPTIDDLDEAKKVQLALLVDGLAMLKKSAAVLDDDELNMQSDKFHDALTIKQKSLAQVQQAYRLLNLHKDRPVQADPLDDLAEFFDE